MTASTVSTLAGAGPRICLICFGPLILMFLVIATECSHEILIITSEAFHKYRVLVQDALYKHYVAFRKERIRRMIRSDFIAEEATAIIHELEQTQYFTEHGGTSDMLRSEIAKGLQVVWSRKTPASANADLDDPILINDPQDCNLVEIAKIMDGNDTKYPQSKHSASESPSPSVQQSAPGSKDVQQRIRFLDLPAEIRNVIYELVSMPLADTQPYHSEKEGYDIEINASTKFHLSKISQTCRLIREEYMSHLFAKHEVTFSSIEFARKWRAHIDKRFTSLIKSITIEDDFMILKDLAWRLADYRQEPAPDQYLAVHLLAQYWICAGTICIRYIFHDRDCEGFKLCTQSTSLVTKAVTATPFSDDNYFTFDHFLEATNQISKLIVRLRGQKDRSCSIQGMDCLLCPLSISVDNRRLRRGRVIKLEIGGGHLHFPTANLEAQEAVW